MVKKTYPIYQIKITLDNTHPPVWRRILVPGNTTLLKLHDILQIVMGWQDSHLHEFTINGEHYGDPENDEWGDLDLKPEERYKISQLLFGQGQKFGYEYDFGDSWHHTLLVEKVTVPDANTFYPICIKGKRACPPEDVGGVWGYQYFLEAISDPNHPEHDEYLSWAGDEFDPEAFDIGEINTELRQMGRGRSAQAKEGWSIEGDQSMEEKISPPSAWLELLTENQKGTVENLPLRQDMVILLSYLRDNRVVGTQSTGNFPLKAVYEICAQFTNPPTLDEKIGDRVYRIRSEEHVWPLYFRHVLAAVGGLILGGMGIRWRISPLGETFLTSLPALQVWLLFQAWWTRVNWVIASPFGYGDGYLPEEFSTITLKHLRELPAGDWAPFEPFADQIIENAGLVWTSIDQSKAHSTLQGIIERVVVGPLHDLGILEVEYVPHKLLGAGYKQLSAIRIVPFGKELLNTISQTV